MKCPVVGLRVASVIFGLMGLGWLIRIFVCKCPPACSCPHPLRWSIVGIVILVALCVWLWMLACKASKPKDGAPPPPPAA